LNYYFTSPENLFLKKDKNYIIPEDLNKIKEKGINLDGELIFYSIIQFIRISNNSYNFNFCLYCDKVGMIDKFDLEYSKEEIKEFLFLPFKDELILPMNTIFEGDENEEDDITGGKRKSNKKSKRKIRKSRKNRRKTIRRK